MGEKFELKHLIRLAFWRKRRVLQRISGWGFFRFLRRCRGVGVSPRGLCFIGGAGVCLGIRSVRKEGCKEVAVRILVSGGEFECRQALSVFQGRIGREVCVLREGRLLQEFGFRVQESGCDITVAIFVGAKDMQEGRAA